MIIKWNDEMIQILRDCADKGMTSTQICIELKKKFDENFTRNAIIGKMHRLGLKAGVLPRKKITKQTIEEIKKSEPKKVAPKIVQSQTPTLRTVNNKKSKWLPFLELKENHCRYPKGDIKTRDLLFCAAPATSEMNRSYCAEHYSLMYQPIKRVSKRSAEKNISQP
jgi:hypothetical protein